MLGRVDPQGSLLETRHMRRHLVTKGSFYERLADHGHELVSDEDFAHLYSEGKGRPSVPPSVMVRAMLCATHDRTSDAETSRRTRVDSDWKAAMGVDDWFEGIGATTFSLMRARMVARDADGALFQKTLERAVEAGIFKQPLTAVIDSSPVHGAGAVASTYELVRKMVGRLGRAMGGHLDVALAAKVAALAATKPDIDWQDAAARKEHLGELLELAATVLGTAAADQELAADPEVAEAAGLLSQVVLQDVEATDDGPAVRQGVAPDRVVSHSDPEMRHGRKSASRRFDGHKLDVIIDEASEMVLGVEVRAGNAGDGEGAAPLFVHRHGDRRHRSGHFAGRHGLFRRRRTRSGRSPGHRPGGQGATRHQLGAVPQDRVQHRLGGRDGHLPGRPGYFRRPAGQGPQGPARHHVLFRRPHL